MADRYTEQATSQIAPVYDTQINQLQSQIPAIQQLYDQLSGALTTQNQQQVNTGTQNIVEDASARGVLRSTLPVDARQALITQLGTALTQGLGQLGLQKTNQIGDVQSKIAGIGVNRVQAITDLANSLRGQDLAQQQADRQYQLELKKLALQSGSGGLTPAQLLAQQNKYQIGYKKNGAGYEFKGPNGAINLAQYVGATGGDVNTVLSLLSQGSAYDKKIYNAVNAMVQNRKIGADPNSILTAISRQDAANYYGFK